VEAAAWPDPTINIQGWDEDAETATVAFQIWVRENGLVTQHDHSLTITLRIRVAPAFLNWEVFVPARFVPGLPDYFNFPLDFPFEFALFTPGQFGF
jgi:hypothetical protein